MKLNENIDYDKIENNVRRMMDNDTVKEKVSIKGLRLSLEKIGNGEIIDKETYGKPDVRLMYKEMLNNDSLILVVHGSYTGTKYSNFDYGYEYEIGLYRNDPRTVQYGGGYGTSGMIEIQHTRLLGYADYGINHKNGEIISEVCNYIKSELTLNENMKKTITLKENELISLIERMIKEYGEDSGGQDMTYGMYNRDNKGLGRSIDFRMMSPMNVALEIEGVLPEKYIDTDVEKAVNDYIEDSAINIQVANKYMKDEDWWDTLYYNIKDIRDNRNINEEKNTKKSVTIIKWFGSDTNENEMLVKLMSDEEISNFVKVLKSKKIKYKLNNTGFYKNTPKLEYWKTKNIKEETGTASSGGFEPALDQPIRKKIRTGLTKEEFNQLKEYMKMDETLEEGKKKTGTKLCARGKAAAKAKFKVYPSAYSNGFAVQVCKGRMKGLDGQKKCSGSYC